MTTKQAYEILAYLSANYPHHTMPEETIQVWVREIIAPLDRDLAVKAVRRVRETLPTFPSIAEFLGVYRGLRKQEAHVTASEEPEPTPAERREIPRQVREWLVERGWRPAELIKSI
jgi:hypothetical protein